MVLEGGGGGGTPPSDYTNAVVFMFIYIGYYFYNVFAGTSTDLTTRFEYEGHKGVSLLTLPRIEGVDVNVFTVDVYMAVTERLDIEWLIPFSNQKDVKLILFFSDNPDWSATLGYALLRRHPQASIAGGYVDNLVQPKPCHYQDRYVAC